MIFIAALIMANVIKHEAQIARFVAGSWLWGLGRPEFEIRSKLPTAEIGAVEALSLFRPAYEHLLELFDIVFGTHFGRHLEKGVDGIGHFA